MDSQILLGHVLGVSREWLLAHNDEEVSEESTSDFNDSITRRINGEPVAYLTGKKGFWNREFTVNPGVLIPRPETELLIEVMLDRLDETPRTVADLGTGSGIIAISLAEERPAWQVTGIDKSGDALQVAKDNGRDLSNLDFLSGDWCSNFDKSSLDAIVSNPPYIRQNDPHLDDLQFEPVSALVSGEDGLDDIRRGSFCRM